MNIQSTFDAALKMHQTGRLSEAIALYMQIQASLENNPQFLFLFGTLHGQIGQCQRAIEILDKSIKLNPLYADAYYNRGIALQEIKQMDDALLSYEKAIALKPDHAFAYYNRGVTLQEIKRLDDALLSYEKAIALKADYVEAYYNRGNLLKDLKRNNEALLSYEKAIALKPDHVFAYYNRGNTLLQLMRFEEALASYDKAISIKPDYVDAYNNRGVALKELKRLEEALESCNKAISIKPDYAFACNNRGNTLLELKRFKEALSSYDKAICIKPDYAEAFNNRGNTLLELKHLEEALASYEKAISIKPDYVDAYNNRSVVLKELKRLEEALESCNKAISIKSDYTDAYFNRGNILRDLLSPSEAKKSYLKALEIDPQNFLARWALAFLSIPPLLQEDYDHKTQRNVFANELKQLDQYFLGQNLKGAYEAVGSQQPFHLAYQEHNNVELLTQYGRLCTRLMGDWQQSVNLQSSKKFGSKKIKIGIVGNQFRRHSVWDAITKGFIFNLDSNKFEIHLFHLGNQIDNETKLAELKADSYTKNKSNLLEWCDAILEKEIEVLIFPEIGMYPLALQLASLRHCPIQIAAWGHPETTGLPTIDYYLSADLFESSTSSKAYSEELVLLPNLGCFYSRLPIISSEPDLHKWGLDTDLPILLCAGTPFKYDPQFDFVLVEIVKRVGKCQLVFFNMHKTWTTFIKERLNNAFTKRGLKFEGHVIFIPWLEAEKFYGLMQCSAVLLDTIGFSGFNTAMQAIDCALPIVTREGKFMRGRLSSGILKRISITELIANDQEEYIVLATRLVLDQQYRTQISQKIIKNRDILYEDMEPIYTLENFLISKCRK